MELELTYREANINDVKPIVKLLSEDILGKTREKLSEKLDPKYLKAFYQIDNDPNQFLMVVILKDMIVATCHLTMMPSLTFQGSLRMQIEAVRVSKQYRELGIGSWMMQQAIEYARANEVLVIQLSTNTERDGMTEFYRSFGFKPTHVGMKKYLSD